MAKTKAAQRRDAAEEVCWSIVLMLNLGGLEIPIKWRHFLYEPALREWCELAVSTGQMRP